MQQEFIGEDIQERCIRRRCHRPHPLVHSNFEYARHGVNRLSFTASQATCNFSSRRCPGERQPVIQVSPDQNSSLGQSSPSDSSEAFVCVQHQASTISPSSLAYGRMIPDASVLNPSD